MLCCIGFNVVYDLNLEIKWSDITLPKEVEEKFLDNFDAFEDA